MDVQVCKILASSFDIGLAAPKLSGDSRCVREAREHFTSTAEGVHHLVLVVGVPGHPNKDELAVPVGGHGTNI